MFAKFLLTVAVVAIVWFGFKYLNRLAELRHGGGHGRPQPRTPRREGPDDRNAEAEAMVECRVCGTWQVEKSARPCGRAGCPY